MSTYLPPCVAKALKSEEGLQNCMTVIASYFRTYAKDPATILSYVPEKYAVDVWNLVKSPKTPIFTCDLVAQYCPDFCDESACSLLAEEDPVNFLASRISYAEWDVETKDVAIWFRDIPTPLSFNAKEALKNPAEARAAVKVYTLEHFGRIVNLGKITVRDKDGRRHTRDLLEEFITQVYVKASKVAGNDVEGVGEVILDLVQHHQVIPPDLATISSSVFVYVDQDGKTYLAVEPRLFRSKVRASLGITSNKRLLSVVQQYGIVKRRIRLKGERGYFFLIPEDVVRRYVGAPLNELVRAQVDISELFPDIGGDDE